MLEAIKILAERIVDMPELYDQQPVGAIAQIGIAEPEVSVDVQIEQLIRLVYDNEFNIFTEEEINHIKEAERECRRKVFNAWILGIISYQNVNLPHTREQRKERIEIAQEEQKWRMEKEKERRQLDRERQLAYERAQQDEKYRYATVANRNMGSNLSGGYP